MCISNIGIIELEEMHFWAYHGCLESEKTRGNLFLVDFRGEIDLRRAAETDDLNDTVNYAEIYEIVKKEVNTPSELLEHLAGRIVSTLAAEFPQFVRFSVRVSKRCPPVGGPVQWSRITLSHCRPEHPSHHSERPHCRPEHPSHHSERPHCHSGRSEVIDRVAEP